MRIKIVRIADRGVPDKERLHLSVTADTTLSGYVVLKSFAQGDGVMSGSLPAFWFPTVAAKAGDQVVLYSNTGPYTSEKTGDGKTTVHFFHWGGTVPLWAKPSDCAVVLEASNWDTAQQ